MILIFDFHLGIDFADNSSINFSWQVGNKYDLRPDSNFSQLGMPSKPSFEIIVSFGRLVSVSAEDLTEGLS